MVIAIMPSACAIDSGVPTSDYCRIYRPITWTEADTVETVRQITRENAKYVCICDGECPDDRAPKDGATIDGLS